MIHPMFSVIVPYRNVQGYIAKAIESVRQQTFVDWELLLIDDASTDASFENADKALDGESPARLHSHVRNAERKTALPNLMDMVQRATGDVIVVLDGDDWLTPNALERIAEEYTNPECGATYGSFRYYPEGRLGHTREHKPDERFYDTWFYGHPLTFKRSLSLASMAEEPEQYLDPDTGQHYQSAYDLALFWPIAYRVAPIHISDVLYYYRRWGSIESGNGNDDIINLRAQLDATKKLNAYWKRCCEGI